MHGVRNQNLTNTSFDKKGFNLQLTRIIYLKIGWIVDEIQALHEFHRKSNHLICHWIWAYTPHGTVLYLKVI